MTAQSRRLLLAAAGLLSATFLALVLIHRPLLRDARPPVELAPMARWLASRPADAATAAAISEAALDSGSAGRIALWRAAYAHAKTLAPPLTHANEAFVRGGLFHWHELSRDDRAAVLEAAAPLMRDAAFFARMHTPLWQLTRDLEWLRRVAPETLNARDSLRLLALSRGMFEEYRELREEVRRLRLQAMDTARRDPDAAAMLNLLPNPLSRADDPLVRAVLAELDSRSTEAAQLNPRIDALVDYALRHHLQPLSWVRPLLEAPTPLLRDVTRARAALALNQPDLAARVELTTSVPGKAEWDPYHVDRARFEAGRGNAAAARAYLSRAAQGGSSIAVLAAAEEIAAPAGDAPVWRKQLLARAAQPLVWTSGCGANELCDSARATVYVQSATLEIKVSPVQSDETPPYVEIYLDDALVAESEVREAHAFELAVKPGVHELEARLVNNRTPNGIQRRVRLS